MHEESITFQMKTGPMKGWWVNTVGKIGNRYINPDEAHRLLMQEKIKPLDLYWQSLEEAEKAAIARSRSMDDSDNVRQMELFDLTNWPY